MLNGSTVLSDFWLEGEAFHDAGDGGTEHTTTAAGSPIPEPGTGLLLGLGLLSMALAGRRGRRAR